MSQGDVKSGNLWQRKQAAGMTLSRPRGQGLAGWIAGGGLGRCKLPLGTVGKAGTGGRHTRPSFQLFLRKKLVQYREILGTAVHQLLEETGTQVAETPGSETGKCCLNSG